MKLLKIILWVVRFACSIYIAYYAINMRTLNLINETYLDSAVLSAVIAILITMVLAYIKSFEDE